MAKRKSKIFLRHGAEADGLREAGHIAAEVLAKVSELAVVGATTGEIDRAAAEMIAEKGCISAFLNYRGFPGNICISVNEEVVHGIGSSRALQDKDIVKIDVGIKTPDGWIGDNAKTVAVGGYTKESERLMKVTEDSLYEAISYAREGNRLSRLCGSVESHVTQFGYTVVKQLVGHGVGRELHEEPQVPNYWNSREMRRNDNPRLKKGMVLAIEPMVNEGVEEVDILEDKWTVVTKDRLLSSHFEHTVLVTDAEPEILTPRPRTFPVGE
ncbi:MAG: type I methionyl aminopeptidase [Verrucomicrobiales bacterium]|nr:type I methionyl aminopeptidase [Verrucomicrobiales bacterium]